MWCGVGWFAVLGVPTGRPPRQRLGGTQRYWSRESCGGYMGDSSMHNLDCCVVGKWDPLWGVVVIRLHARKAVGAISRYWKCRTVPRAGVHNERFPGRDTDCGDGGRVGLSGRIIQFVGRSHRLDEIMVVWVEEFDGVRVSLHDVNEQRTGFGEDRAQVQGAGAIDNVDAVPTLPTWPAAGGSRV